MLGFVNSKEEDRRQIGGEIFRETRKRRIITLSILGAIAFAIFNAILYYLTKV